MTWNQASRKYILALSLGGFIILLAGTVAKVLTRLAFTPGGGLEGEDTACPQQIDRKLGVYLAGEEKPETSVGLTGVKLLLKGDQPRGSTHS